MTKFLCLPFFLVLLFSQVQSLAAKKTLFQDEKSRNLVVNKLVTNQGICPNDYDCDGVLDHLDDDDDNDGILDVNEGYKEPKQGTYELSSAYNSWSLENKQSGTSNYFSSAKYTFTGNVKSERSYMVISSDDKSSKTTFSLPEKTSSLARLSSTGQQDTWTRFTPDYLKLIETSDKSQVASFNDLTALTVAVDLASLKTKEITYTIKFFNKLGKPRQVINPVLHIDRIGSFEDVNGKLTPCSVKLKLNDGIWKKIAKGTKDFYVDQTTVYDNSTIADVTDKPDSATVFHRAYKSDSKGTAAGSLMLVGTYSEIKLTASLHGEISSKSVLDGFKIMVHFNSDIPNFLDTDEDSIPNYHDLDSDGDGCPDALEGANSKIKANDLVLVGDGKIADDNPFLENLGNEIDKNGIPKLSEGGQGIGSSVVKVFFTQLSNTHVDYSKIDIGETAVFESTVSGGENSVEIEFYWKYFNGVSWVSLADLNGFEIEGDIKGMVKRGGMVSIKIKKVTNKLNKMPLKLVLKQSGKPCVLEKVTTTRIIVKNAIQEPVEIKDFDGDDVPDHLDLDDDNDGVLDYVECDGKNTSRSEYYVTGVLNKWKVKQNNLRNNYTTTVKDVIVKITHHLSNKNIIKDRSWKHIPKIWTEDKYSLDFSNVHPLNLSLKGKSKLRIEFFDAQTNEKIDVNDIHFHISGLGIVEGDRSFSSVITLQEHTWEKISGTKDFEFFDDKSIRDKESNSPSVEGTTLDDVGASGGSLKLLEGTDNVLLGVSQFKRNVFNPDNIQMIITFKRLVTVGLCDKDSDGDGILDYQDLDSDSDGCPDALEGGTNGLDDKISLDNLTKAKSQVLKINAKQNSSNIFNLGNDVNVFNGVVKLLTSKGQVVGNSIKVSKTFAFDLATNKVVVGIGDDAFLTGDFGLNDDANLDLVWEYSKDNGGTWESSKSFKETTTSLDLTKINSKKIKISLGINKVNKTLNGYYFRFKYKHKDAQCYDYSEKVQLVLEGLKIPEFDIVSEVCFDQDFDLPGQSINGVKGVWSPSKNLKETTNYTFTPSGQDATPINIKVLVKNKIIPEFKDIGPFCEGKDYSLPVSDINNVKGVWDKEFNSKETTTYVFTPIDSCSKSSSITIIIDNSLCEKVERPEFDELNAFCQDDPFELPKLSKNGVSGTWSPKENFKATTTYKFTPKNPSNKFTATMTVKIIKCGDINPDDIINDRPVDENKRLIYNVITLKIDGFNDYLKIKDINKYPENTLRIYNRWGALVYEKHGYNSQTKWKGCLTNSLTHGSDGVLSTDTYFYVFLYKNSEELKSIEKGWLYIKSIN